MLEALISSMALGLVAGLVPGPFVAFVAATALQHGLRAGLRVALAPLAIETPVMLVTVLFLSQIPTEALRWVGMVGGLAIAALGLRTLWRAGRDSSRARGGQDQAGSRNLLPLVTAGLLSPAPWVFWTALGGPLLLRHWHQGVGQAAVFFGSFLAFFIGSQMLVAFGTARGAPRLKASTRRRVTRGVSVVMVAAGAGLTWLAATGNFQKLLQTQREVQERLR